MRRKKKWQERNEIEKVKKNNNILLIKQARD